MNRAHRVELWIGSTIILLMIVGALLLLRWRAQRPVSIRGAVTVQDTDSRKEEPIADVEVTADLAPEAAKSDSTGLFALKLRRFVRRGQPLVLHFRQPRYHPLDVNDIVGDKLYGGDEDCYLAFVERRLTAAQRARLIFENHALHARVIKFSWRGRPFEFSSPPEPWFTEFINAKAQVF